MPPPAPAAPLRPTIAIIVHGSRSDDPGLRDIVTQLRERGIRVRPRVTFELGDAATFAREEADAGADVVVAAGGDGTVNEVLNGLSGRDVPMGILPLGTANDFAKQAGIPDDAAHAMDLILTVPPLKLDTAELNGRRFLNVSAGGIGAEATAETSAEAKSTLGTIAYALTGLKKLVTLESLPLQLRAPGMSRQADVLLFFVGNARTSGGGMPVTPLALANDGLLDVCIVERMGRGELAKLALKVRRGEHLGEPGVLYFRVPWLEIQSPTPIHANVDGERTTATTLRYRARAGDLRIHLPRPPEEKVGLDSESGARAE